jgi:hypothetical protein
MASTNISKAFASSGTRTKWTWSFWLKRGTITNGDQVVSTCHLDNDNQDIVRFGASDDKLDWWSYQAGSYSNGGRLQTNRVFRDCNGWYHIVLRWDSSNSTAGDRMKMWVNGVEETSFATDTNPTSGRESLFNFGNNSITWKIGSGNNTQYFDGLLAHIHFCDNQLYQASNFGESDSNGVWIPKSSPSVTYGTNGYFLKFDNSGNMGLDSSGNSNNFTTSGTLTQAKDTPSNVFAVFNTLDNYYPAMTLSNGNTKALTIAGKYTYIPTTLGMTSGKYYAEIKVTAQSGSQDAMVIGITSTSSGATTDELGHYANDYGYYGTGNLQNNDSNTSYGSSYTTGDIIGIAIDLDNNKLYFSKNSVWQNSGVPTSGSTGTGAVSITDPDSTPRGAYFFAVNNWSSTTTATFEANFGNGYFGTTAVTSAGTNASGNGIFEYDVPTGYTALSTKGLDS